MESNSRLKERIHARFDGDGAEDLSILCERLITDQKATWPECRKGYEALGHMRERDIVCGRFSVQVQFNKGRMRSSVADVGENAVNGRPCFLCVNNLPEGQKAIVYRDRYLILCNPMPVFPSHLTISYLNHHPQSVTAAIATFLLLVTDFGERWIVLYNGPKCGASAPDHLHLQAVPSGHAPIEREICEENRVIPVTEIEGVRVGRGRDFGREVVVLEGKEPASVARAFDCCLAVMRSLLGSSREPLMNIVGLCKENSIILLIFPRDKHRPDAFYREGEDRVLISPAVLEMAGVMVAPAEKDFERLDRALVEEIYREVSLKSDAVEAALLEL
jgi:hypothetical protein